MNENQKLEQQVLDMIFTSPQTGKPLTIISEMLNGSFSMANEDERWFVSIKMEEI